jgi:hypothetical protein
MKSLVSSGKKFNFKQGGSWSLFGDNLLNIFEYNVFILSQISLSVYSWQIHREKSFKFNILIIVIAIPLLYFSLDKSTSFLTVDETYIITEAIDLKHSDMRQWNMGASRTTDLTIGTVFSILNLLTDFSENYNVSRMTAKSLHWYMGFILILYIHFLMNKYFLKAENRRSNFVLFLYLLILMPSNNLALGIFNYDLFSMLLAGITVIFLSVSIKNRDKKAALTALIFAMLAAQEKLSAAPLLPISILLYTYCSYQDSSVFYTHSVTLKKRFATLIFYASVSMGIALSVSISSYLIAGVARGGLIPPIGELPRPLTTWAWPILSKIMAAYNSWNTDPIFYSLILFAQIAGAAVGSELIRLTVPWLKEKKGVQSVTDCFRKYGDKILLALFLAVLAVGGIGTYTLDIFIGPTIPLPPGNYQPPSFNGIFSHFGVSDFASHIFLYLVRCYAIFFNALPTALVLLFIFSLFFLKKTQCLSLWLFIGFGSLTAPFIYGLTLTPASIRYQNIPLLFFLIFLLYIFDRLLISRSLRLMIAAVTILAVFSEVVPFAPVHAAFRPIWSNFPEQFSLRPPVGKSRIGAWEGWGEELMIAGKRIEKMCLQKRNNCEDVRLYYLYPGDWLDAKIPVKFFSMIRGDLRFTKNDYYVINRGAIIYGGTDRLKFESVQPVIYDGVKCLDFEAVQPYFTISLRGYTQAWIFRGDQLRNSGT